MTYASVQRRLTAFALDLVLLVLCLGALQLLFQRFLGFSVGDLSRSGWQLEGISLLTVSLPMWLYFYCFERGSWQATPGKKLLRMIVTDDDGGRLKPSKVLLRTFVKMFPIEGALLTYFLPSPWFTSAGKGEFRFGAIFVVGMGFVYLLMTTWNDQRQSMHDLIAETIVLEKGRGTRIV